MGIPIGREVVVGMDSTKTTDSTLKVDRVSRFLDNRVIRVSFPLVVVGDNILVVLQHTQEVINSMLGDKQVEVGKDSRLGVLVVDIQDKLLL